MPASNKRCMRHIPRTMIVSVRVWLTDNVKHTNTRREKKKTVCTFNICSRATSRGRDGGGVVTGHRTWHKHSSCRALSSPGERFIYTYGTCMRAHKPPPIALAWQRGTHSPAFGGDQATAIECRRHISYIYINCSLWADTDKHYDYICPIRPAGAESAFMHMQTVCSHQIHVYFFSSIIKYTQT